MKLFNEYVINLITSEQIPIEVYGVGDGDITKKFGTNVPKASKHLSFVIKNVISILVNLWSTAKYSLDIYTDF